MGSLRVSHFAVGGTWLLLFVCLTACGNVDVAKDNDSSDGSAESRQMSPPMLGTGATSCVDACASEAGNAQADATTSADDAGVGGTGVTDSASTVGDGDDAADSASTPDGPPVVVNQVCRLAWTQAESVAQSDASFSLEVDASGNTYVLLDYFSIYGLAIVKIDPQCHLVWTRTFSSPPNSEQSSVEAQIALDSASNVTVAGTFYGTVDFGLGPVSSPAPGVGDGFVTRLDANGNTVFFNDYGLSFPTFVSAGSDGVASVLFLDYGAYDCSFQDGGCADGGDADVGPSFYSFVQVDPAGNELARHSFGPSLSFVETLSHEVMDSTGAIWALDTSGGSENPTLDRLTQAGDVLWSRPMTGTAFALTPSGAVTMEYPGTTQATSAVATLQGIDTDGGLLWTQSSSIGSDAPSPFFLAAGTTGAIYTGGTTGAGAGVEVYDAQGRLIEIRSAPAALNSLYMSLGIDPSGNAIVAGDLSYEDGGFQYLLVKLGP